MGRVYTHPHASASLIFSVHKEGLPSFTVELMLPVLCKFLGHLMLLLLSPADIAVLPSGFPPMGYDASASLR
eukprot:6458968-Amphidinium_carterae.1